MITGLLICKFKDDYSHIRKNLAENLWRIKLTKKFN